MKCPRCKTELPPPEADRPRGGKPEQDSGEKTRPGSTAVTPEEALRADAPPAPCPQCGWSTMWNE
jgi:hypothetical protein